MNALDVIRALRRSWWLVLAVTAVCVGVAAYAAGRTQPTYQAHTQLFATARPAGRADLLNTYQGGQFTQQRVQSYVDVATSPTVTEVVIRRLGLPLTPSQLAGRITVSVPAQTVLINIAVDDHAAGRAQAIAAAVGERFIEVVNQLEKPKRKSQSPIRLSVSVPAQLPSAADTTPKKLAIAVGVLLGLLLGCVAALVRARLDTRIRTTETLSRRSNAHVLGVIPYDKSARRWPVPGLRAASPARGEALRALRTSLRFVDADAPPRTIVVTSALPREGKTTVAVGLAMALAEAGVHVALVEGDLREPCFAERLELRKNEGLVGALVEGLPAEKVLQPWHDRLERSSMEVIVAGAVAPNPSELLGSARMAALLNDLRARFQVVVVDAPALLPITDAAVLAAEADGVIVVARLGRVRPVDLGAAFEGLAAVRARLLGLVANGAPRADVRAPGRRPPEPGPTTGPPMAEALGGAR